MGVLLKKGVPFCVILLALLALIDRWMDWELNPHYPLQYREAFYPRVKADVIILGASHATHGINPAYLEGEHLKVFNFSLNGAGPLFNLTWYRKVFRPHYPKPKYVLYAVHWIMFDDQHLRRRFEQDSRYFPLPFLLRELKELRAAKELLLNRFALFRERKHLAGRLFGKHFREPYLTSKYYNGFIPFERKTTLGEPERVTPNLSPLQVNAFEELLDELKKDGVRVIFVHVPGYLPGRRGSKIADAMEQLYQIAQRRGIPFLDYETHRITSINLDKTFFSDNVHLNEKGSDFFSKLLKEDLKNHLN